MRTLGRIWLASVLVMLFLVETALHTPVPKTAIILGTINWQKKSETIYEPITDPKPVFVHDMTGVNFSGLHEQLFGKCGQWYVTARLAGWPAEEWPTISKVMWRESRCDPKAWNGADAGLMQINRIHTRYVADMGMVWPDAMFNAYKNLLYARVLWDRAGWEPWKFKGVTPGE